MTRMTERMEDRCIVSGIGQSDVARKVTTKGVLALTLDACLEAITDAALVPADIDGVISWPGAVSRAEGLAPPGPGSSGPGTGEVMDALRLEPNWHYGGPESPGMFAAVIQACMAVASGVCRHVLVYRALNEATSWRLATERVSVDPDGVRGTMAWMLPYGAFSGPNWMGLWAMRHMHEFGTTREQFAAIALNARRNAQRNPKAVMQGDLTLEDYLGSKMISDPLCLFDCDIAVDAATAVIVSTVDHAPDLPHVPIHFEAIGSALKGRASWDQWQDMSETAAAGAGAHLWSRTDLKPGDVDVAGLYDGFSVLSLFWLEGMQFCGKGESGPFVEGGTRIALDGELPLATSGGQLSAGRLHGYGHLYEVCLQLRGEATGRQVTDAKLGAVSAGAGPLASCLLLRRG
jgi:acetyl-CoA acetyltransferase